LQLLLFVAPTVLPLIARLSGGQNKPKTPDDVPRFERDVLPILQTNCLICHGEAIRQKCLDLRTHDAALEAATRGQRLSPESQKKA